MQNLNEKYRIMAFKDFVPDSLRFILIMFFALIFQFSGGIYLASISYIIGGKTLLQEDIMMAGYASFIGMSIVFPLLFRIKFRFTTKTILVCCSVLLIFCNIISVYTKSLPILVIVCFIAGIVRMVATFECFSTSQLIITPARDFTVFFPVIYLIILGSIQVSGMTSVYLSEFYTWQYMHVLIVALLLLVLIIVTIFCKNFRFMKKLPFYGIDWKGIFFWLVFLFSVVFVFIYGEYMDWFDSSYIRVGAFIAILSFILAVYRMLHAKRPFISIDSLKYKNVQNGLLMFFIMTVLLSLPNIIQNSFTSGILHYDHLNSVSLNWFILIGIILGALFSYYWFAVCRRGYKWNIFIGFTCIIAYMISFYFIFDGRTGKELLYFPLIMRGAGNTILYIGLTLYVKEKVPFHHFFMVLCIVGFVRSVVAGVLGSAIFGHSFKFLMKKNIMILGSELDTVNPVLERISPEILISELNRQSMLVSLKELTGWVCVAGIFILIILLTIRNMRPSGIIFPRFKIFLRYIKRLNF